MSNRRHRDAIRARACRSLHRLILVPVCESPRSASRRPRPRTESRDRARATRRCAPHHLQTAYGNHNTQSQFQRDTINIGGPATSFTFPLIAIQFQHADLLVRIPLRIAERDIGRSISAAVVHHDHLKQGMGQILHGDKEIIPKKSPCAIFERKRESESQPQM